MPNQPDEPQKPRYGAPGKTPGSAEGEERPRREVDPGKTPGKAEGEQFENPRTSHTHTGPKYE